MNSLALEIHSPQACLRHQHGSVYFAQRALLWQNFAKTSSVVDRSASAFTARATAQQSLPVGQADVRANTTQKLLSQLPTASQVQKQDAQHQQQPQPIEGPSGERPRLIHCIRDEWQAATRAIKSGADPEATVLLYFSNADRMASDSTNPFHHQHVNATLHGISQVWLAAAKRNADWQQRKLPALGLQAIVGKILRLLQPRTGSLGPRSAGDILWSCSMLDINPNEHVPGIVDALGMRFLQRIDEAQGHHYAHALIACARLQLDPCAGLFLLRVTDRLGTLDMSSVRAQHIQNITHSLARMPPFMPSEKVIDALSNAFLQKLQSENGEQQAKQYDIASMAWSLNRLKHQPQPELASAMTSRVLEMCQSAEERPTSHTISVFLRAAADLRFPLKQEEADTLTAYVSSCENLSSQSVANTAWALAVMDLLQPSMFKQLVQHIQAMAETPPDLELLQLYQALQSLEPASDATTEQTQAWLELQTQLKQVASKPLPDKAKGRGTKQIKEALSALGIPFISPAVVQGYRLKALVPPQKPTDKTVFISCGYDDTFSNHPDRVTGRGCLFRKQLAKHGQLVLVSNKLTEEASDQLRDYLEQKIAEVAAAETLTATTYATEMTPSANVS